MPELPEVETIVRDLHQTLPGKSINNTQILQSNVVQQSKKLFKSKLLGKTFKSIRRRGKNILAHVDPECILVVNLGMTGRLGFKDTDSVFTHPAVYFQLDNDDTLIYDDVRRFGTLNIFTEREWKERSKQLGPEPLSSSYKSADLHQKLVTSRAPIRSWLLNQKNVAGVGNIYANESLYLSGIHPGRSANSLTKLESNLLHQALQKTLSSAINNRGTTLRNYRDASGLKGTNGANLTVYGREGQSCVSCSEQVSRIVFSNRSAFFCPGCQK